MEALTPTERRLMDAMADGMPHGVAELVEALGDDQRDARNLRVHVSNLRAKLGRGGLSVLCDESGNRTRYRLVRLMGEDG